MTPTKTMPGFRGSADCHNCCIKKMVLFANLTDHDLAKIHLPIDEMVFAQGAVLFDEGGPVKGIYTLRSGMVKLVRSTRDGRQRIVRVLREGDVIGLEALATASYDSDAVALTPVTVCRIPMDVIKKLMSSSAHLQTQLMNKWQQMLKDADDCLADLNFGTARQRVGNLVLKMRSTDEDGDVTTLFSRDDMGAMLDLKLETVSREVSRLVREGAIEQMDKQGRVYRVRNSDLIEAL